MIRVTVWNEFRHELQDEAVRKVYPKGIHEAIAQALGTEQDMTVRTATLDMPEHGLTQAVLDETDVLLWWGHMAHGEVDDAIVDRVQKRVWAGMGLIVLHSGHASKIMRRMLGTPSDQLRWREDDEMCRLWVIDPTHPIAAGVGEYIDIPADETYGEHFSIPAPDELVFMAWYPGGEVFRSGCCWKRELGRMFYFQPGHETYPIYYQPEVVRVLRNAVRWAAPTGVVAPTFGHVKKLNG